MRNVITLGTATVLLLLATQIAYAQYEPAGTLALSGAPEAGGEVTVSGSGYLAGSEVSVTFRSDPVLLTTVTANQAGSFITTVTLPEDATGTHQIEATGIAPDGSVRVLATQVDLSGAPGATTPQAPVIAPLVVFLIVAAGVILASLLGLLALRRQSSA